MEVADKKEEKERRQNIHKFYYELFGNDLKHYSKRSYSNFLTKFFDSIDYIDLMKEKYNTAERIDDRLEKELNITKPTTKRSYYAALKKLSSLNKFNKDAFGDSLINRLGEKVAVINYKEKEKHSKPFGILSGFRYDEDAINKRFADVKNYFYDDNAEIDFYKLQFYPIMTFFLRLPIRHSIFTVKFTGDIDMNTENYIYKKSIGDDVMLVLNDYKTMKNYGRKIYNLSEIDEELNRSVLDFLEIRQALKGKIPHDYLFYTRDLKPLIHNSPAKKKIIEDAFNDKTITNNILRKIFISKHYDKDIITKIIEVENKLTHLLLNSENVRRGYYLFDLINE